MKVLLVTEWLKLKKYATFWLILGMFAALLPLWNYGISGGILKFDNRAPNIFSQAYSFQYVWANMGYWTSIFVVFIAILVIIITTNEYQFRTNRQNIIYGWTKSQFYHAKWLLAVILSLVTTLFVFICGFFFGISNGSIYYFPGDIYKLFYVFLLCLNYCTFCLTLSLFIKRSGLTIGIFLLYCMIIETIIHKFVNWRFDTNVGSFLPLQCSDELLPFPILDIIKTMAKMKAAPPDGPYIIASFIWIAIYYFVGRKKLLSTDW